MGKVSERVWEALNWHSGKVPEAAALTISVYVFDGGVVCCRVDCMGMMCKRAFAEVEIARAIVNPIVLWLDTQIPEMLVRGARPQERMSAWPS